MSSALLKLLRAAMDARAPAPVPRAQTGALGQVFMDQARDNPAMFQRGRSFADSLEGLQDQFGVEFSSYRGTAPSPSSPMEMRVRGGMAAHPASYHAMTFGDYLDGMPRSHVDIRRGFQDLTDSSPIVEFDTTGFATSDTPLSAGGGSGRGGYAALFGAQRLNPGAVNFAEGLSGRNQHRRNYNQAAAIMRDPALADRIALGRDQVKLAARELPKGDFRGMAPSDQVGLLQTEGALRTMQRLGQTRIHPDTHPDIEPQIRRMIGELIPFEDDPSEFARAANILRRSGAPASYYDTIGASALKRAALAEDVLSGAPLRRHLFDGLEYCAGGSVTKR
jgi:hypothetical protein